MQLIDATVQSVEFLPEPAGFTLVEEDDVAFTLGLCREVNRLYSDYQGEGLALSEGVLAGLVVTVEMLASLSRVITDGMPAMRITVAAAQTREMLAVMFDRDPMDGAFDWTFRERYRSMVAEAADKAVGRAAPSPAAAELTESAPPEPAPPEATIGEPASAGQDLTGATVPEATPPEATSGSRLQRLFRRRRKA